MRFKRFQAQFWVHPFFRGARNHTGTRVVVNRDALD